MSTITRHLQVESLQGTIKVIGDRDLVADVKEKVDTVLFEINSAEYGSIMMLKITLRQPMLGQYEFEYELPKMGIIHILEDEGFKIISTMFDAETKMERIMMYKEVDFEVTYDVELINE